VPDLDYRFDKYTEEYQADELARVREFARSHPLADRICLEIGTNRGRFLSEMAERSPEQFFLGVEWTASLAETAKARLERRGVDNAAVIQADANHVLPVVVDPGQLSDVFVLYPDPWWKKRHRKRRVIQPAFLDMLAPRMTSGGRLWIRTDVGTFADDMRQTLDAHEAFAAMDIFDIPSQPFPRSTRERHVIGFGLPVHLLYYVRS
jgi:tRNA (guanine-N7-)-methyltransferase